MSTRTTFGRRGPALRRATAGPTQSPSAHNTDVAPHDDVEASLGFWRNDEAAIPAATIALVLFLVLIFAMEINRAFELDAPLSPSVQALIALGGMDRQLVFGHAEWWRVFTAPLLHVDLPHLIGNCFALALIGRRLEPLIGAGWFVAIFSVSALGGAAGSLAQNDPELVSVGASGAISGLLSAALIASLRTDDERIKRRLQVTAAWMLVPAILPAFSSASANKGHIDYAAHLGGAMAGAILALLLVAMWNKQMRRPSLKPLALAISCAFAILVVTGFTLASERGPVYAAETPRFIPKNQIPADMKEAMKRSTEWIARYPADPRGYLYRGRAHLDQNDASEAAGDLRQALSLYSASEAVFKPEFGHGVKLVLALAIKREGDLDAARDMARQSCEAADAPQQLLALAQEQKICP